MPMLMTPHYWQLFASQQTDRPAVAASLGGLSDLIGKVVASHAAVTRSIPAVAETAPIYTMHEALRACCP